MKIKFIYLAIFALLFIHEVKSQNTIDIIVSDSIHIEPSSFEYIITCIPPGFATGNIEKSENIPDSEKEVLDLLNSNNYEYNIKNRKNYSVTNFNNRSTSKSYSVNLTSKHDLENLVNQLYDIDNINAELGGTAYEKTSNHEERLYDKVLENGKIKAQLIARKINKELVSIISIEELERDPDSLLFEMVTKSKLSGYNLSDEETTSKVVYKKIRITYLVK